jgi:hypothetical protein
MTKWLLALPLFFSTAASALEIGMFHLDVHAAAGSNLAQGNWFGGAGDFYTYVEDNLAVGVGAFYSAGLEHPNQSRVMGAGPFVSYAYPFTDFLIGSAREELDYLDERNPILVSDGKGGYEWDYFSTNGMASVTTLAMHLYFTKNFGVSAGYRFELGLNNSDVAKDHSGFIFGLAFAI